MNKSVLLKHGWECFGDRFVRPLCDITNIDILKLTHRFAFISSPRLATPTTLTGATN